MENRVLDNLVKIGSLVQSTYNVKPLEPLPYRKGTETGFGVGKLVKSASSQGIASPLTELETILDDNGDSSPGRAYWPPKKVQSSDGLFTFEILPIKQIAMSDGLEKQVIFLYANP
jgi:hypothetical protein